MSCPLWVPVLGSVPASQTLSCVCVGGGVVSVSISVSQRAFPSLSERSVKLFKGYIIFDLYQMLPTICTFFYLSV